MLLFVLVSLLRCLKPFWWHILWMTFIFPLRNLMGSSFCLQCSEISWCYLERGSVFIYCTGHSVDSFSLEINVFEFGTISWNICLFPLTYCLCFLFLKRLLSSHQASQNNPPVSYFYFLCLLLYSWGFAYFYIPTHPLRFSFFLLWAGSARQNPLRRKKLHPFWTNDNLAEN